MYSISDDQKRIQIDEVMNLLAQTYWANKRPREVVEKSIENSLCVGAYLNTNGKQIGFARVITDYATTFYICDVIVDGNYRGYGIGKALIAKIVSDERIGSLRGILVTKDAHGLYEQFGFLRDGERFMGRTQQ